MKKHYFAQTVSVKNDLVFKNSYIAIIRDGEIFLKSKGKKSKKYEIENIFTYGDEKLIKIKEEKDFSFSMLMSFAGAIFTPLNFVLGLTLFSMGIIDILRSKNFKYILLKEIEIPTKKQSAKILQFIRNEKQQKAA